MDTQSPSTKRYYRPELDVVRFLAFLLVFLFHNLPVSTDPRISAVLREFAPIYFVSTNACRFGLSLFFTLSAFLICELLLRERETAGTVAVKQFYFRRILRIWPLYYFGVALGAIYTFMPGGNRGELINFSWFVVFLGAWRLATHGLDSPMVVVWSVSVEEQFYLIAPWILKYCNRKSLCGFCALLVLASNGWLYHLGLEHASSGRMWADSLVQFQCFAAGIVLSLVLHGRALRIAASKRLLLLAGSCLCWYIASAVLLLDFSAHSANLIGWSMIGGYALAALGSVVVLLAFLGLNPTLLPRWAVYLGRISFGLYVFHELADYLLVFEIFPYIGHPNAHMFLARICAAFGLTVLMAALSYRYFETPFLKLKSRHAVIESRPV